MLLLRIPLSLAPMVNGKPVTSHACADLCALIRQAVRQVVHELASGDALKLTLHSHSVADVQGMMLLFPCRSLIRSFPPRSTKGHPMPGSIPVFSSTQVATSIRIIPPTITLGKTKTQIQHRHNDTTTQQNDNEGLRHLHHPLRRHGRRRPCRGPTQ